jgi:WS/DGAT C-terminal domain
MLKLIIRQRVNVVSADLPGPQTPLYFAGARLLELFPLLNLLGTESIGVGALSYSGQFNVMAVGDADICPDIDIFAESARADLHALVESTGTRVRGSHSAPERAAIGAPARLEDVACRVRRTQTASVGVPGASIACRGRSSARRRTLRGSGPLMANMLRWSGAAAAARLGRSRDGA